MPEIILEFSLNRSSGVLAGIVASLARAGIEFQHQKLTRAAGGRGGRLTITGSGDSPDAAVLAARLDGIRGVEKLMRVIVDGEAVLAKGRPMEEQAQPSVVAELSAAGNTESEKFREAPEPPSKPPREVSVALPDIEELPILSDPRALEEPRTEFEPEPESQHRDATLKTAIDPAELDLAAALSFADECAEEDRRQQLEAEPTAENDLTDALQGAGELAEENQASTTDEDDNNPVQAGPVLRRRRRRRR